MLTFWCAVNQTLLTKQPVTRQIFNNSAFFLPLFNGWFIDNSQLFFFFTAFPIRYGFLVGQKKYCTFFCSNAQDYYVFVYRTHLFWIIKPNTIDFFSYSERLITNHFEHTKCRTFAIFYMSFVCVCVLLIEMCWRERHFSKEIVFIGQSTRRSASWLYDHNSFFFSRASLLPFQRSCW